MMHWGREVLARTRLERGLTQGELAHAVGMSEAWVRKQEAKAKIGDRPKMHPSTFKKLAGVLSVPLYHLDTGEVGEASSRDVVSKHPITGERVPSNFTIRKMSRVAADSFAPEFEAELMNDEGVPGALYPEPMEDPQLLTVVGNSMTYDGPDSIEHGDMVLYANAVEEEIEDGRIVVARHHETNSNVVKVFQRAPGNMVRLLSLNPAPTPAHAPIEVPAEQVDVKRVLDVIRRHHTREWRPSARVVQLLKSKGPNPPRNL